MPDVTEMMPTDTRELRCGCLVVVPTDIPQYSDEEEGYLRENGYIKDRQVGVSQWNAECSQCHATLERDI